MKKYKLVVLTNAVKGKEKEYNDWYQNVHLKDIVSIKSFVSAQRFRFDRNIGPGNPDIAPYLAIYDIETDDIARTVKDMKEAAAGGMVISDGLDRNAIAVVYEEFGEVVKA